MIKDFAIEIDALPYVTIEGRAEIELSDGHPTLGTIEQIISHTTAADGTTRWNYGLFTCDALGNALEEAVRDALEADAEFMRDALTEALEDAASEREEALERRAEERREERMMEEMT